MNKHITLFLLLTSLLLSSCVPIMGRVSLEIGTWEARSSISLEKIHE